eukprot:COSAG01_NODE_755_length_13819_cov_130.671939_8_plen_316_part_00
MNIFITGVAGFIGSHVAEFFLNQGYNVIGIDNLNNFYDPSIKERNLSILQKSKLFKFFKGDILDQNLLKEIGLSVQIDTIIHLAAMAGVRPSIQDAAYYYKVNITGTFNILEFAKEFNVKKMLFASSSSVYGNNTKTPYSESDNVDFPISPYAATKKAAELMCHTYFHLYKLPIICLRFFTVYGPRQRPEMAIHKFTKMILNREEIPVYNHGKCLRDYTYIDDIVHGISTVHSHDFLFDIINLGESHTISTLDIIKEIEKCVGIKAKIKLLDAQQGDVNTTYADITKAKNKYAYSPSTSIFQGIKKFIDWYKSVS